ncbi:MAG TPA: NAD(P)/FAD-dependent oxidoreductase [Pyrinomonadaceae bacterium]|nr:NAD(P)/FAD-dependent oxidoreductase [Pyrinomonadaceae bacterium]
MNFDAIVIGGGAAGLFCAITAGKRGKRVLVIEHNQEVGRKIIISGGGRCNFTNLNVTAENFISQNPHFCKSALAGFTPQDFTELVRKHKIAYYEKTLGQLFCRESSRLIVDMLLTECDKAKVQIKTGCSVTGVSRGDDYQVETSQGIFTAAKVIVACGGLSFPKIGATGFGYDIARQFGLKIVETRPSLVALVMEGKAYAPLAGISMEVVASSDDHAFRENIVFTHRGMSGPAVLQVSNYWRAGVPVSFHLTPETDVTKLLTANRTSRKNLNNILSEIFPLRFATAFAEREFDNKPLYQMNDREFDELIEKLNGWQVKFSTTEGYDRAEVTLGGVSTRELSSKTMESKKMPGLYFIGEVVDVTGWLGGYNFQWAWSSGFAAGNAI